MEVAERSDEQERSGSPVALILILLLAAAVRFSVASNVFVDGRVYLDGPDGYYHLHRARQTVAQWPSVPQTDSYLNAPRGGLVSWPPLFDFVLATVAVPFRGSVEGALEIVGAIVPLLLGVFIVGMVFAIVREMSSRRAALAAATIAALLPGVVRYTLAGALDHDPFFEASLLVALYGLARSRRASGRRATLGATGAISAGLASAILGWTGAVVGVAIFMAAFIGALIAGRQFAIPMARAVATGATASACIVLPFVLSSRWVDVAPFTFEGLSFLHLTSLLIVAAGASIVFLAVETRRARRVPLPAMALAAITGVPLVWLLPRALGSFVTGSRYASGEADILFAVAEARPLLFLLGELDVRPMLVRLSLTVLCLPLLGFLVRRRRFEVFFVAAWCAVPLYLAFAHSRFTFDAAIALSAAGGIVWESLGGAAARVAFVIALALPALPAYLPLSGWEEFNFYRRGVAVRDYELDRICEQLRRSGKEGAVLNPWYFGHWVIWYAHRPVVLSPMLSVGQSEFSAGLRAYLETDPAQTRLFLEQHSVRYVVLTPEMHSIRERSHLAGLPRERFADERGTKIDEYVRTVEARLMYFGGRAIRTPGGEEIAPLDGFREVAHSRGVVPSPFGGYVPLVRVFEVE